VPVYADEEVTVLDSNASIFFPGGITFSVKAQSPDTISRIRLLYKVERLNYADVVSEAWPIFSPSSQVEAQWTWDMRKANLPPGGKVQYWWIIEDDAGHEYTSPVNTIDFNDTRYEWQEISSGPLTLYWYEGDELFAEELINAGLEALERLTGDTGTELEKPVDIYIYASSGDLQSSMIFPREWTGGVAFTEFSTIAIGVSEKNLDWGKDALAHELGHMFTHQHTFSPYGTFLPTWLDEGLAMYAEANKDAYLTKTFEKAIAEQELISLRSLSSPFSAIPEVAYLSYAQSRSVVEYMIEKYGNENILLLLTALKEGESIDNALMDIYGFDQDELEEQWREAVVSAAGETQTRQMHPILIISISIIALAVICAFIFVLYRYNKSKKALSAEQ
jgi:hypothetical protein